MKKQKSFPPNPGPDVAGAKPETPASKIRPRTTTRTSTIQNLDGSLARNGKIACLPAALREAINRALARGVSGPALLEWINADPETQAVLRREFKGQPISPQNLSLWRQGGFRDWLRLQEAREVFCEFAARHQNLSALELNEKIALWLGTRMVCMTGHLEQLDPQESWPVIRQMVHDVAALRRGDHRIREQKFKERAKDKITREEHMRWAMEPGMLDWLVKETMEREGRDAEKIREIRYGLFGLLAGDDPEDLEWEARKRGVPIEQLDEARDAAYSDGRALQEAEAQEQTDQHPSSQRKKKPRRDGATGAFRRRPRKGRDRRAAPSPSPLVPPKLLRDCVKTHARVGCIRGKPLDLNTRLFFSPRGRLNFSINPWLESLEIEMADRNQPAI